VKLAASVADRMVADMAELGWPEGTVLGSEPELLERYGVSRAVFREAVRLLEHKQMARMRRGPGGGLVITAPTLESVIDTVAVYFFYANARVDQVTEARIALEEIVAEKATSQLTEQDTVALRHLAQRERDGTNADHREFHTLLAAITKNPALEMFVSLLSRLHYLSFPDITRTGRDAVAASVRAHVAIIDAVLAGDEGLARHRMRTHLEAEAEYLNRRRRSRQLLDPRVLRSLEPGSKRGEQVAREIFVEVTNAGWPVGRLLGSEADLMERYGVSRAVLREAIRLLEHHQIATMRRGPGGGLFVSEPGVESATAGLALVLERWGIKAADLVELRIALELTIIELVVKGLNDGGASRLLHAFEVERDAASSADAVLDVGHDLHGVLAGMVDNPVFELLTLVLIQLTRMHHLPPPKSLRAVWSEAVNAHAAIVEAVVDRDLELARSRMRRHLDALPTWVH
jgi:DNA-binding FadR family transcriptional regulator